MSNLTRSITTERLFNMGPFANLRFSHTLNEIPEHIALDKEAMTLIQKMLLLDVEYDYRRYINLIEKISVTSPQEILDMIDGEREETFTQLFNRTQNKEIK